MCNYGEIEDVWESNMNKEETKSMENKAVTTPGRPEFHKKRKSNCNMQLGKEIFIWSQYNNIN